MKRITFVFFTILLFSVACSSNENRELVLPDDIPDVVQLSDFDNLDWGKNAKEFGEHGVIGNENKSGVIGADAPSLNGQKWMWHLWGIENPEETKLTVVGLHQASGTVQQILTSGWMLPLAGENNGADAHTPSSVQFKEKGKWMIMLYTNDSLFDTLVFDISE